MSKHDETSLPKWAQGRLQFARQQVAVLQSKVERIEQVHALLKENTWFVIPGPTFAEHSDVRKLFALNRDEPEVVCSLGIGDRLFVGRAKHLEVKQGEAPERPEECHLCGATPYLCAGMLGSRPTGRVCELCGRAVMEEIL